MLFSPQVFRFAAPANVYEPLSVSKLIQTGATNQVLSIQNGLDYEKILNSKKYGVTNQPKTFRSFEEDVNKHYPITPVAPISRLSKRVGLMGYKIGMTHFWDKWGKLTPCTVI
jgi:hypothetical protein